ncbi:TIGR02206 family membrane protein [Streptococcus suis]|uniref:YwaF family protein n=1 Tax=Streptococcus suis TaxID=1307 RepID=UPI002118CD47|nr:TIGR02206 family membrane protein [Streptococcus suis]
MNEFFTNQISHGPHLTLFTHFGLLVLLFILLYLTKRYYTKTWFKRLFWPILLFQVISLYTWYVWAEFPLSENLPFYHCRLAILFLLFARKGDLKLYFSYLGLIGSVVAFIYPVFDPFPFPHLTFFTHVVGHYALAVMSLSYILAEGHQFSLSIWEFFSKTAMIHLVMLVVNWLTKGNYGFLTRLPIVNSQVIWFNFFLLTLVLSFLIGSIQAGFQVYWKKRFYLLQD